MTKFGAINFANEFQYIAGIETDDTLGAGVDASILAHGIGNTG